MSDEPVFPIADCSAHQFTGMTLRDYFAAQVLPAAYRDLWDDVRAGRNSSVPEDWPVGVALDAYRLADAMLAARQKASKK